MPSDRELRSQLGVSPDVDIFHRAPRRDEVTRSKTFLQEISGLIGLQGWRQRSLAGKTLSIFLVGSTFTGIANTYQPIATASIDYAEAFLQSAQQFEQIYTDDIVLFSGGSQNNKEDSGQILSAYTRDPMRLSPSSELSNAETPIYFAASRKYLISLDGDVDVIASLGLNKHRETFWTPPNAQLFVASTNLFNCIQEITIDMMRFMPFGKIGVTGQDIADRLVVFKSSIIASTEYMAPDDLPSDYFDPRADHANTRHTINTWVRDGNSCVLLLPSRKIPKAYIAIINQKHPDFAPLPFRQVDSNFRL